jgi:hypothetical protein
MGLRIINTGQGGVLRARSFGLGGIFRSGYTAPPPVPPPVANLLLDDYPNAAAAYSLRKLRTAYTGAAIRVRRSNDNAEQDIGFDVNGNLDETALTAFVGANSGFVTTWYDQSGTKNLIQATAASQPRIINSGTIDRENGKVTIRLDGTNDVLYYSSALTFTTPFIFMAMNIRNTITTTSDEALYWYDRPGGAVDILYYGNATGNLSNERLSWITSAFSVTGWGQTSSNINSGNYLYSLSYIPDPNSTTTPGETKIFQNNSLQFLVDATNGFGIKVTTRAEPQGISRFGGSANTGGSALVGSFFEIVIYNSNQSSNRSGIQTNINTYYSIY